MPVPASSMSLALGDAQLFLPLVLEGQDQGTAGSVTTELSPAPPEPILPREIHSPARWFSSLLPGVPAGLCPEHPPCPEQEWPICSAGCLGGLSRAPALWGPLPPPAGQQVPRKVTERPRPGPTAPRPHWRTRAAILSIFGQIQRRVPRPLASLRLFEVSLGALICLPPAASPARQFLVESRLTAPLLPGLGGTAGQGRVRGWERSGTFPEHPTGASSPARGETGLGPRRYRSFLWVQRWPLIPATGAAVLPWRFAMMVADNALPIQKTLGAVLGAPDVLVLPMSPAPAPRERPSSDPSVLGVFRRSPFALSSRGSCVPPPAPTPLSCVLRGMWCIGNAVIRLCC